MLSKETVVQIIIIFVGLFDICNNIAIILEGKLFCCLLFYFVFKILAKLIKKKKRNLGIMDEKGKSNRTKVIQIDYRVD